MYNAKKGQGATEYLLILGVVVLIATISISLLGFFPGSSAEAKVSQSDAYWQAARPFAILGHSMGGAPAGTADYWAFDEASGTSASDSVGGLTATVSNGAWVPGKYGNAIYLSGYQSYALSTSGISTSNSITVEGWINLAAYNSSTYNTIAIIGSNINTSGNHWLYLRSNRIYWTYANGTKVNSESVAYTPQLDTWLHIAVTHDYSAKEVKFYVNGVQVGATQTHPDEVLAVSNKAVRIGAYSSSSYMLNGTIDNFRIYDSTISPSDAASLANEGMLMAVQHNGQAYRTITTMQIGNQIATVNTGFGAGEKKTLNLAINHGTCISGAMYEFNVTINYDSENLPSQTQSGAQKLVGRCA